MTEDQLDQLMMDYTEQMVKLAMMALTKIARTEGTQEEYKLWAQNALMAVSTLEQRARQAVSEFEATNK